MSTLEVFMVILWSGCLFTSGFIVSGVVLKPQIKGAFNEGVIHARKLFKLSASYFLDDHRTANLILSIGENQPIHQVLTQWRSMRGSLSVRQAPGCTVDIKKCARCGCDHDALGFSEFLVPIEHDASSYAHTHWAPCPGTGEPIIMAIIDDEENETSDTPQG